MGLIAIDGPIANGEGYTLGPSETLRPETITVAVDGTGAAAAFKPCAVLLSQEGLVLSRTFPDQEFAAGDDGTVTFSPF